MQSLSCSDEGKEREIGSPAVALLKSLMTVELRSEYFEIKVNVYGSRSNHIVTLFQTPV